MEILLPTCMFELIGVLLRDDAGYLQLASGFQEKRGRLDDFVDRKYRFEEASLHIADEEGSIGVQQP